MWKHCCISVLVTEEMANTGDNRDKDKNTDLVDDELHSLLDNALEDFDKPLVSPGQSAPANSTTTTNVAQASQNTANETTSKDLEGNSNFMQFEEAMKSFLDEDPAFKEQMQKLADAAISGTGPDDEAFAASLAETLKGIAENAQSLSENPSEEELSRVLGNLGLGGTQGDGAMPDLIPLMQNVMQSLLSKDLLYPALKEIVDKYPDWLAVNRSKLEVEAYEKYNHQYELMKRVCDEFDAEQSTDSKQTKTERFERILQLMQKMQDLGHPPKEIIQLAGEGSDLPLDEQGNLRIPGMSGEQCSIM